MAVLETSVTLKTRETMKKTQQNNKKQMKKVLVVAQELKLARVLAGNNKTARDRALKSLKKWFQNRSSTIPFTEDDFLRLWKGLFYSMWMSDKPLIQEECAENISNLIHALPLESALLFYKCGMMTLMNEWFGIDQLRLDKFLMFVRRLLRQAFFVLKNQNWSHSSINKYITILSDTILAPNAQKQTGLLLHFIEIFLEELSKVSDGELSPRLVTDFLEPFIQELAYSNDGRVIDHIKKNVFFYLIRQSDLGLEYDEKYKAWRNLGFPGRIDSMKKINDEENSDVDVDEDFSEVNKEKVLDPRAGKIDVELQQIKFHPKAIAKALAQHRFEKLTNSKSRKCLSELAEHFRKMASGIYPLGVKKIKDEDKGHDTSIRKAVNRLVKFDQKIKGIKKRKIGKESEIELRSGKKIKLDESLTQHIEKEFTKSLKNKRKIIETPESPPPKQQKISKPQLEVESAFNRNSGTWIVTKTIQKFEKKNNSKVVPEFSKNQNSEIHESEDEVFFANNRWETSNDEISLKVEASLKKKSRLSLPMNLMRNPFADSTPLKKVKINTKLNMSQDIRQHHVQIFGSPDIPYDPHKKPTKPLLKTPITKSPVNPFFISNFTL